MIIILFQASPDIALYRLPVGQPIIIVLIAHIIIIIINDACSTYIDWRNITVKKTTAYYSRSNIITTVATGVYRSLHIPPECNYVNIFCVFKSVFFWFKIKQHEAFPLFRVAVDRIFQ